MAGSTGRGFLVLRPTLSDIVLKMPRGAQVIYPKDLGAILIAADIAPGLPGARGRGRIGCALHDRAARRRLRGRLRAARGLRRAGPRQRGAPRSVPTPPYRVEIRDVTEGIDERDLDRILLDMPEPHNVVAAAAAALRPGGILLAYLPTINQTALLRQALDEEAAPFGLAETQEIIRRTWHVEARSVRPDHRMVGHTGFLTTARRLGRVTRLARPRPGGRPCSVPLDEDALAGALLGGLDDGVLELLGHPGHAGGAARLVLDVVALLHVGEPVVEQGEHGRRDLLAQAVARAEILIDPDLHP